MRTRPICLVILALLLLPACASPDRRKIYFVRLGDVAETTADDLIAHYKDKFAVTIDELPAISLDATMLDRQRNQIVAESLIALIREKYPYLAADANAIIIGLTREDIYIRQYDWKFAFNFRQDGRLAVISMARMDPVNFGLHPDEQLLNTRLRKMVTKNIGVLYFQKPLNNNPRSVLYSNVMGLEELDAMSEEF